MDFLRHNDGVQGDGNKTAPDGSPHQGLDAPLAHRRPGYPLSCVPAEPDSVSPGTAIVPIVPACLQAPLDTVVIPQKIHPARGQSPPRTLQPDDPGKAGKGQALFGIIRIARCTNKDGEMGSGLLVLRKMGGMGMILTNTHTRRWQLAHGTVGKRAFVPRAV